LKKLITISLLFIHLFNIGGQLLFYEYAVYKSDKFFDEQIARNRYSIADLVEIRIPANIPGASEDSNYECTRGRVQFGNTAYNYVKMKITPTAIYLICIPNYATTRLSDQNIINIPQIADIPVPKKDHVPFGKINLASYSYQTIHFKFSIPLVSNGTNVPDQFIIIPNSIITGPGQPPDRPVRFC
jgi:hypothetical protein